MYEKFNELVQKHNVSIYQISKSTGISQQSLSNWKRGLSCPKVDKLQRLADYFGVPLDYFIEENVDLKTSTSPLTDDEVEILVLYRNLKKIEKIIIKKQLKALSDDNIYNLKSSYTDYSEELEKGEE